VRPFETVRDFLEANGWKLVDYIDLGMTAHVFVVEVEQGSEKRVLKTRRGGAAVACPLRLEYRILRYLGETDMARFVPAVGEWIHEVDGFLMAYLRHPMAAEWRTCGLVRASAVALRTLHGLDLPPGEGVGIGVEVEAEIADDRPQVNAAIRRRLQESFEVVTADDSFWAGLSGDDRPKLAYVRAKYGAYVEILSTLDPILADTQGVLTHGDLSGDNLMVRQDGSLALADWGEARITSNLTDVAYLLVHTEWDEGEVRRFLRTYFDDDSEALGAALPAIEALSRLYRYNACVRSLRWLNDLGTDGLDVVGQAYFERQLEAL
jgi:aminoglycoside phosphotransferase